MLCFLKIKLRKDDKKDRWRRLLGGMRLKHLKINTFIWLIFLLLIMPTGCSQNTNITNEPSSMDKVILAYLDNKVWSPTFKEGKIFTAYKLLGQDTNNVYLWVYMKEYNGYQSGILPLVLNVTYKNNSLQIISHQKPRDGAYYSLDIKSMFPKELQDQVNISLE